MTESREPRPSQKHTWFVKNNSTVWQEAHAVYLWPHLQWFQPWIALPPLCSLWCGSSNASWTRKLIYFFFVVCPCFWLAALILKVCAVWFMFLVSHFKYFISLLWYHLEVWVLWRNKAVIFCHTPAICFAFTPFSSCFLSPWPLWSYSLPKRGVFTVTQSICTAVKPCWRQDTFLYSKGVMCLIWAVFN